MIRSLLLNRYNKNHEMAVQSHKGFTLIELAIVLFIISLLMVGLLGPVATQIESQERQQTINTMNDIIEALYGFAVVKARLPCPDADGDGRSDPVASGTCTAADGWLPWQTLGLNIQSDAWGNRFKYHVTTPKFTTIGTGSCDNKDAGGLSLCASGDITIRTRNNGTSKKAYDAATSVPAIVVSHGKNALGATTVSGTELTATTAGTDEAENADTDNKFYSRIYSGGAVGCSDDADENNVLCQFDDIVMWISPYILMNRLVKAEVLH